MKINLHKNNWTVLIEELDLRSATQQQMNTIAGLIATNTCVVIKNQSLSEQDEVRICEMIGKVEHFTELKDQIPRFKECIIDNTDDKVVRVTGEKDEHGNVGLFGHVTELDWHCNQSANEWRKPIVWLYGVKGTSGSRTSWTNAVLAYRDLPEHTKEQYKQIKLINGFKKGAYSPDDFGKDIDINYTYTPNLVHTNNAGVTGLYFQFLQIHQVVGYNEDQSREFILNLKEHVLQEKYIYHHDWDDGDVVMSEQWLGVHKRWKFENIHTRMLHRITLDFDHADIDNINNTITKDIEFK